MRPGRPVLLPAQAAEPCRRDLPQRFAAENYRVTENSAMSPLPIKILAAVLIAAFALASPADAEKAHKHRKVAAAATTARADGPHHGPPYSVPGPPLYFGGVYLGSDPDPNISFQIMRDVSGRFGGDP